MHRHQRSQGAHTHTHLPITINALKTLKSQFCSNPSFSPLEKRLLWAAFTLAFYGFLRASEFSTAALIWQHIYLETDRYTVSIEQSKTNPFHCGIPSPSIKPVHLFTLAELSDFTWK